MTADEETTALAVLEQRDLERAVDAIMPAPLRPLEIATLWKSQGHPIGQWLRSFIRTATHDTYARTVVQFAEWYAMRSGIGADVLQASVQDAQDYRDDLMSLGLAPSTLESRFAALASLFGWLVEQRIIPSNPVAGLRLPERDTNHLVRYFTLEEIGAFFAAIPGDGSLLANRDRALFALLFRNGLRVSEACGARLGDISTRDGAVLLAIREHGYDDQHVKGGRGRDVLLTERTWSTIQAYLALRGFTADAVIAAERSGDWRDLPLFCRTRGNRWVGRDAHNLPDAFLDRRSAWQRMQWYGCDPANPRNAGLDAALCHPHVARHTFISWLVELGVPLNRIMQATGHRKLETLQHYVHMREIVTQNAARSIPY